MLYGHVKSCHVDVLKESLDLHEGNGIAEPSATHELLLAVAYGVYQFRGVSLELGVQRCHELAKLAAPSAPRRVRGVHDSVLVVLELLLPCQYARRSRSSIRTCCCSCSRFDFIRRRGR